MPTLELAIDASKAKQGAKEFEHAAGGVINVTEQLKHVMVELGAAITAAFTIHHIFEATEKFEHELNKVARFSDYTREQMEEFGQSIINLSRSTPATTEQLLALASTISDINPTSPEELMSFTSALQKIADMAGINPHSAAEQLIKLKRITGDTTMTLTDSVYLLHELAETMDTSTTAALDMTSMLARLTSSSRLSEREVMALSVTMSKFGLEGRAVMQVGTLFNTMQSAVVESGQKLIDLSFIAGKSSTEMADKIKNHPTEAVLDLLGGLKKLSGNTTEFSKALDKIGLDGNQAIGVIKVLTDNVGELERALGIAAKNQSEWTKLNVDAQRVYNETGEKIKILWNNLNALGLAIGLKVMPFIDKLVDAIRALVDPTFHASEEAKVLAGVLTTITVALTTLTAVKFGVFLVESSANMLSLSRTVTTTNLGLTVTLALLTAISAADFGTALYERFAVVQKGAAMVVNSMQHLFTVFNMIGKGASPLNRQSAKELFAEMNAGIKENDAIFDVTIAEINRGGTTTTDLWSTYGDKLKTTFSGVADAVLNLQSTLLEAGHAGEKMGDDIANGAEKAGDEIDKLNSKPPPSIDYTEAAATYFKQLQALRDKRDAFMRTPDEQEIFVSTDALDQIINKEAIRTSEVKEQEAIQNRMIDNYDAEVRALQMQIRLNQQLNDLNDIAVGSGDSLTTMLDSWIVKGESFTDVIRVMAQEIESLIFRKVVAEQAAALLTQGINYYGGAALTSDKGNAFTPTGVVHQYAMGGVVDQPSFFKFGGGQVGSVAEREPEAIMPLRRLSNGRLGVESSGGGSNRTQIVNVKMDVHTPDQDGFRRNQRTLLAKMHRGINAAGSKN